MPVKSSSKSKSVSKMKTKSKGTVKKSAPLKKAVSSKNTSSSKSIETAKPAASADVIKKIEPTKTRTSKSSAAERLIAPVVVKRRILTMAERRAKSASRANQFNFMKAPIAEHAFEVGDTVEVFCDHEKLRERVRGWIKGIVVQVDNKMVAVQFRSNVFLTDGWMVPDRILWYPLASEHIRSAGGKKPVMKKDFIPDY
jgi:hypothetical protein